MRFSQRLGYSTSAKLAQRESIDDELRASLWSALTKFFWEKYRSQGSGMYGRSDYVKGSNLEDLIEAMWLHYFKQPIDTIDTYWEHCHKKLRTYYFKAEWYEVYDFIEFIATYGHQNLTKDFIRVCNIFLERENSAYRFINSKICEVTSQTEIDTVENAIASSEKMFGVNTHLKAALTLYSDRKNPDYRNSIKESISSIESLAKQITGDNNGTLGSALTLLEKNKAIHPALKKAFSALYGYTSDADGIRHALMDESESTKADAKFMLVSCSAFVNYIIDNTKK